jgi:hypothetical protein
VGWGRSKKGLVKKNLSPEILSGALGFAETGCPRRLIELARDGGPDLSTCRTHGKHVVARVSIAKLGFVEDRRQILDLYRLCRGRNGI